MYIKKDTEAWWLTTDSDGGESSRNPNLRWMAITIQPTQLPHPLAFVIQGSE